MTVKVSNEQDDSDVDVDHLVRLAAGVLAAEGADQEAELSIGLVDEERMRELNEDYTGRSGATDVLAFGFDEGEDEVRQDVDEPVLLGDVVICPAVAARNASELDSGFSREMSLLVVHGILHLLGYDHATDEECASMQSREAELLDRFGVGGRL